MRILKFGLLTAFLAFIGLLAGFAVMAVGSIIILWEFPGAWQPVTGLSSAPKEILALDAEKDTILIRTDEGRLFTCVQQTCSAALSEWGSDAKCDGSTRPAVVSLFPILLSRQIKGVLSCERSYTDIARTTTLLITTGGIWISSGVNLLPTDATIVGLGLIGGVIGIFAGLVTGAIISLMGFRRNKQQAV